MKAACFFGHELISNQLQTPLTASGYLMAVNGLCADHQGDAGTQMLTGGDT